MTLLIFTPTFGDGPDDRMMESVSQQLCNAATVHEVSWLDSPRPGRDFANVVEQYQKARKMCLAGGYEGLITVEHDMILPPDAVQKLYETDAPVVYGVYMLRHGVPALNAWHYINNRTMGMSLSLYPNELKAARDRGWVEVCGVGWGCTFIRREVLERFEIHSNSGDAGDIAFASKCLRAGIKQVARFDVPCEHILPDGTVLEPFKDGGIVYRVYTKQPVPGNVIDGNEAMAAGKYFTLSVELAEKLKRASYVQIMNEVDRQQPEIAAREMAVDPKAAKRSKRNVS